MFKITFCHLSLNKLLRFKKKTKVNNISNRKIWYILQCSIVALFLAIFFHDGSKEFLKQILPNGNLLQKFLIPRPPQSANHRKIQKLVQNYFLGLRWKFEKDTVIFNVKNENVTFTNLIASFGDFKKKRIVLACHYDSKIFIEDEFKNRKFDFIGATDSAWSCSLLLYLARVITYSSKKKLLKYSIQIVFFDGEEAIEEFSESDSLYGSRHLAEVWSKSQNPMIRIDNIEYFVLLDLLGSKDSNLYNFFPQTRHIFHRMHKHQEKLRKAKLLKPIQDSFNVHNEVNGLIDEGYTILDDHVPFAKLNVPIVHLIPIPFPSVWHSDKDDITALDHNTCHNLALVLQDFILSEIIF